MEELIIYIQDNYFKFHDEIKKKFVNRPKFNNEKTRKELVDITNEVLARHLFNDRFISSIEGIQYKCYDGNNPPSIIMNNKIVIEVELLLSFTYLGYNKLSLKFEF